ncbi:undecaprenyl diphosphate synthase [Nautilia profundicola AmH]|uniref:Isoprenyl transferase n=1 Tax=Nautilia profundicola (strain ATCC BAA-1463 / DSM 18972 / AmH) TaxID=598659 RepID=B9LAA4_NAUPA|nr:di-trans,poly-cis-decaprenylcistransferase [Nautilia profundicola]ACM92637.1 undecaprenyl diphosphate synthase [Nautilia profundicola AmH]
MHLAIIMDGNGRWAKKRGLKRIEGHKKGAETVRKITEYCAKNEEISVLTLYAFSTENWKRPKMEVEFLMKLLEGYLEKELETYIKNDIKFETIGDISKFSEKLKKRIQLTKEKTKNNKKLTQVLALNYGSKNEITRAVKKLIEKNEEITEENIQNNLDLPRDVDLLIRTSGEIRLSNFLLWQCAYAEMFFTNTLWPDFTPEELDKIIKSFHLRERRFGGV